MLFDNFEIHAVPHIQKAYCKCGAKLYEVSNGLFSRALYCSSCENVYQVKLVKVPIKRLNQEFIDQCRKEYHRQCSQKLQHGS
jgi:hypothetical protein